MSRNMVIQKRAEVSRLRGAKSVSVIAWLSIWIAFGASHALTSWIFSVCEMAHSTLSWWHIKTVKRLQLGHFFGFYSNKTALFSLTSARWVLPILTTMLQLYCLVSQAIPYQNRHDGWCRYALCSLAYAGCCISYNYVSLAIWCMNLCSSTSVLFWLRWKHELNADLMTLVIHLHL